MLRETLFAMMLIPAVLFGQGDDHFQKAKDYYKSDQYREALYHLKKLIAKDSTQAAAFKMRGNCYLEINQLDSAKRDYEKAITLAPEMSEVYFNLSIVYGQKKLFDEEEMYLRKYLRAKPSDPDALVRLAILIRPRSRDSSFLLLKEAYRLAPDDLTTNDALASALLRRGEYKEAYEFCVNARKSFRHHYELIETQAYAAFASGMFAQSASLSDTLQAMQPHISYQVLGIKSRIMLKTKPDVFTQKGFNFMFVKIRSNETATLDKWVSDPGNEYFYPNLLARYRNKELLALDEYFMLYYGFTTDSRYSPYFSPQHKMNQWMKDEKYQEVAQEAKSILEKNEFDPEIIEYLFAAQKRLDQPEYLETLTNYLAIMEGIQATGTGESYDEAWIVIAPSHEYDIMSYIGEQSTMQSLRRNGGHDYDVLSTSVEGSEKADFYFNIDKPFRSLSKTFNSSEEKADKKRKKNKEKSK